MTTTTTTLYNCLNTTYNLYNCLKFRNIVHIFDGVEELERTSKPSLDFCQTVLTNIYVALESGEEVPQDLLDRCLEEVKKSGMNTTGMRTTV